jgi:hypothetical protein
MEHHGRFSLRYRQDSIATPYQLGSLLSTCHQQHFLKVREVKKGAFAPFLYCPPTDLIVSYQNLPVRLTLWRSRDAVYAQVSTLVFFFLIQTQTEEHFQGTVNYRPTNQGNDNRQRRHNQLWHEGDASRTTECLATKDACSNSPPGAAKSMQGPDTKHVIYFPAILVRVNM